MGRIVDNLLGAIDLAIDVATLGEYGLQTLPDVAECELTACGWEALAPARRRGSSEPSADGESADGILVGAGA